MSRMFDDGAAPVAQKARTRVIRCPHCSIELNLPDSALGRRLKCPKCEVKFEAPTAASLASGQSAGSSLFAPGAAASASSAASSLFLPLKGASSGSVELPSYGTESSSGSVELPTSLAPLRETFDLPLLGEDPPRRPAGRAPAPKPEGDALALFQDEPKSNRKPKGAEARSQPRRCTSCSSVVPAGMSLCSRCGLDLDTGQRHTPLDIFEDEMPAARPAQMPPVAILAVGSICGIGFLLLAAISTVNWAKGVTEAPALLAVWLFGLFGAVQFLRQKSIKKVFVAASLTVVIAAFYLIAVPVYNANYPPTTIVGSDDFSSPGLIGEAILLKPLEDRLDLNRIYCGVGSLLSYAALAMYLNSPSLRRQFHRR